MRQLRPSIIVNAAAYTAVDKAESETDLAFTVNALAPAVLGQEAAALGAWLIHFSTDYVFDGGRTESAYVETDSARPINAYGRSKLAGESAIAAAAVRNVILRASWIYGAHGANFAKSIIRKARSHDRISVVADQFGAHTSSGFIAQATAQIVMRLAREDDAAVGGIYHLQDAGHCSW